MTPHPRADLDFYIEPEWCTSALLALPTFSLIEVVYDPCVGSGSVARAARATGRSAHGSDIVDRSNSVSFIADFRHTTSNRAMERKGCGQLAIVSNPPYGRGDMAEAFIRHFVPMRAAEVVAVFVQTRFLHSAARHAFFQELPPSIVALMSTRPSCPPGDAFLAGEVKASGGSQDYCWLIYDKRAPYEPTRTVWLKRPATEKAAAA